MAQELPYFRFTVQEWQNGNISLERYELQGLFISICGFYWLQDCHCTLALLQKKFGNATNEIKELIELGIIKHEKKHDKINIDFLMTQFDLLSDKRKRRQVAGSKGGNATAKLQQKGSYKDKDKDNNKDKDNEYTKFDFKESLLSYGFNEDLVNDWLLVRRNKKATNTATALKKFTDEVEKANIQANEVMKICIERSWAGFNHEWLQDKSPLKKESKSDIILRNTEELLKSVNDENT